jgi:uncharacterized membrane protein YccC
VVRAVAAERPSARELQRSIALLVPDIATGVRAATATLIPFFLAGALDRQELGWIAVGGWLGTLVDPGGMQRIRAKYLIVFGLIGAVVVMITEAGADKPWLATVLLVAISSLGALARAFGGAAGTVGTITSLLAAIGAASHTDNVVRDGLLFAAGAAWGAVLSTIVWPVWTHLPVRRALAQLFGELSAHASALEACAHAETPPGDPAWASLARLHQRRVRGAIEEALAVAVAARARRAGETRHGADLRALLAMAEAQFPLLIALGEELEARPQGARADPRTRGLAGVARIYDDIAHRLATPNLSAARAHLAPPSIPQPAASDPGAAPSMAHALHLARRLERASHEASSLSRSLGTSPLVPDERGEDKARPRLLDELRDALRTLRDALSPRSVYFRHALRVGVAVAAASIVAHRISTHPHWVTITTIAIMQPHVGPTITRAVERVVGTVLGSVIAAIITTVIRSPIAVAALMFPLSVAAVTTKPRSYRLFTCFLTPVFVLLAERFPGDWWTAAARAGDAVVGGVVALAAALVVFPASEQKLLPDTLAAIQAALDEYSDAVLSSLDHRRAPRSEARIAAARRAVGIALGEAETSLERLLAEPGRKSHAAEDAMQRITKARRRASAVTTLDARAARGVAHDAVSQKLLERILAPETGAAVAR